MHIMLLEQTDFYRYNYTVLYEEALLLQVVWQRATCKWCGMVWCGVVCGVVCVCVVWCGVVCGRVRCGVI